MTPKRNNYVSSIEGKIKKSNIKRGAFPRDKTLR